MTYELTPTIWGYARIGRGSSGGDGGTGRRPPDRVDVMVPPVLTPDEFADLHCCLRTGSVRGRRTFGFGAMPGRGVRRALDEAIEVQTSEALDRADRQVAETPLVGAFARLVVRGAPDALTVAQEALARELAWAGVRAACHGETADMVEAVLALDALLVVPRRA